MKSRLFFFGLFSLLSFDSRLVHAAEPGTIEANASFKSGVVVGQFRVARTLSSLGSLLGEFEYPDGKRIVLGTAPYSARFLRKLIDEGNISFSDEEIKRNGKLVAINFKVVVVEYYVATTTSSVKSFHYNIAQASFQVAYEKWNAVSGEWDRREETIPLTETLASLPLITSETVFQNRLVLTLSNRSDDAPRVIVLGETVSRRKAIVFQSDLELFLSNELPEIEIYQSSNYRLGWLKTEIAEIDPPNRSINIYERRRLPRLQGFSELKALSSDDAIRELKKRLLDQNIILPELPNSVAKAKSCALWVLEQLNLVRTRPQIDEGE